ncbi:MAG: FAD-binding oxidoreductase [Gammaproteobacteria bacterium]|nr:FAD-binding oxidoreductase [Gammaproteobacteria bacterium]MBQ0839320.1 FAD-binding oxidoreductase [Gammaproteobacteria bacterium]
MDKNTLQQLQAIVGEARVLCDADSLQNYGLDRTTVWTAAPCAIVLPGSIEEVQAIVRLAASEDLAIVPSGGRTGLSGGAVARSGELVLALDRMNKVIDFNAVDRSLTCQAGIITQQLQEYAAQQGLFYPVDFAATGSSQIGGNIATNAGGINVIRYGMTRDWVLGLKVVTGNGDILELNRGLLKNNTGYDFRHLFIGSEGTLGIICEATLRLAPPPQERAVLVLGVSDFPAIMDVLKTYSGALTLNAFEFFSDLALEKVLAHQPLSPPFTARTPYYALLEIEQSHPDSLDTAMSLFEHCVEQGWVLDGVVSQNQTQAKNLWRLREDISETLSFSKPYKNDIAVTISKMPDFILAVDQLTQQHYPDFEVVWFGHIGDGNLHLNILKPDALSVEDFNQQCNAVSVAVAELVQSFGGSISAEHGIGLLKKPYLSYTRSDTEIALMQEMKRLFDPQGILNPGKLI